MTTVILDIRDGESARFGRDGYEFDRIARVAGLTGPASARSVAAIAAVAAYVPYNSPHPERTNSYLRAYSASPERGSDVWTVTLTYRASGAGAANPTDPNDPNENELADVTFDGALEEVTTTVDRDGHAIQATYNGITRIVAVTTPRPRRVILIEKTVTFDPQSLIKNFNGTVCDGPWKFDLDATEGEWICEIVARSRDEGTTWRLTIRFTHKQEKWFPRYAWQDENGHIPADATLNTALTLSVVAFDDIFDY